MIKSFTPGADRRNKSLVVVSPENSHLFRSRSAFTLDQQSLHLSPRADTLHHGNDTVSQSDPTYHQNRKKKQLENHRRNSQALLNPDHDFQLTSEMYKQPEPLGECDYDNNPILLYQAIEKCNWETATEILDDEHDIEDDLFNNNNNNNQNKTKKDVSGGPDAAGGMENESGQLFLSRKGPSKQAATWVVRKESDGKLRWRLLPIHAAILFHAPVHVLESIVESYPSGAKCKDDQGMLPLHLAFRYDSADEVINYLLSVYPEAIHVKDRKGRIPVACATTRKTSRLFQRANLLSTYADIASSRERNHWVKQANESYEKRINDMTRGHTDQIENVKEKFEEQLVNSIEQVGSLRDELRKVLKTNEELENNAKLMVDYETKLITKVSELITELDNVTHERQKDAQQHDSEIMRLMNENLSLQKQVKGLQTCHGSVVCELNELKKRRMKEDEEKNSMKSTMNDVLSCQRRAERERDMLAQTVEMLKSTLGRQLEEHSCIRQTLLKQEQDMNSSTMLRQRLLSMLAKQEVDITEVSRLERAKINNILDRRTEEIFSVLREVTLTKQPSSSTQFTNTDTMATIKSPQTSCSESILTSKLDASSRVNCEPKNRSPSHSTTLTATMKDISEPIIENSKGNHNTLKNDAASSVGNLLESLGNETKDTLGKIELLTSGKDTDHNNIAIDDPKLSLDSITSPPRSAYSWPSSSLLSPQKVSETSSSAEQQPQSLLTLSNNHCNTVRVPGIELKSTFDLPNRPKCEGSSHSNCIVEPISVSPRVTFKTPRASKVFASDFTLNPTSTMVQNPTEGEESSSSCNTCK